MHAGGCFTVLCKRSVYSDCCRQKKEKKHKKEKKEKKDKKEKRHKHDKKVRATGSCSEPAKQLMYAALQG